MPKDTEQNGEFTVDAQKLRNLLDTSHSMAQASSERSSALGQHRKSAAEAIGCHKDAFSICERIDKMSDDKLADFIRSFDVMYRTLFVQWSDRIGDMVDKAEAQTKSMEDEMA